MRPMRGWVFAASTRLDRLSIDHPRRHALLMVVAGFVVVAGTDAFFGGRVNWILAGGLSLGLGAIALVRSYRRRRLVARLFGEGPSSPDVGG